MGLDSLVAGVDFSTLPQQLVNGVLLGAIYALIALGYTMVYGVLKLINFAHGEVFMLGAYTALFVSWQLGFAQGGDGAGMPPSTLKSIALIGIGIGFAMLIVSVALKRANRAPKALLPVGGVLSLLAIAALSVALFQPQASTLFTMLVVSMAVCGTVGVLIELLAYRPMRDQPRIAALITAIGVSLLLQYGGALVLPTSPPPSINEKVNPYRGSTEFSLSAPDPKLVVTYQDAKTAFESANSQYEDLRAATPAPPSDVLDAARDARNAADRAMNDAQRRYDNSGIRIRVPTGQLIMLATTLGLMLLLTYLVMYTAAGRAMRAVSHDFDSAALMGVNVGRTVSFTFFIGSVLAGAGAMMNATFIGTPLTTFYGMQPGVKAFVAAVLGGIGNIPGAVLGAFLMGLAETMVVFVGGSVYRDAIAFVILIVVLLFRPGGLLGSAKVEKV